MKIAVYSLLLICIVMLASCKDNNSNIVGVKSTGFPPIGTIPFNNWSSIDNVLRISSGTFIGTGLADYSSVANAWFYDASSGGLYAVDYVKLNNQTLSQAGTTRPNYYNPDDLSYIRSGYTSSWDIRINGNDYNLTQSMPSIPNDVSIAPMDSISKASGATISWTTPANIDTVLISFQYNSSLTAFYDTNSTDYGFIKGVYVAKDDNGTVTFSSSDMNNFPVNTYAELTISWGRMSISTGITNKNTVLVSTYSYSIPIKIIQ